MNTFAQAYAGHQFGHFTNLGDGRAIMLGEHLDKGGKRFDVQLKGSGITPYSRNGDGKAALGPMLREYIISEAIHYLNIPTTRSLSVIKTGEDVFREKKLQGSILTRIASSHIRVGTFQYAAAQQDIKILKSLFNYTVERHYSDIKNSENIYIELLKEFSLKQINLITNWMRVGFIHGVMNTDNMSILGETFDYGPYAFMETYDPNYICNHTDSHGRYSFSNQPSIAEWNCYALASALIDLFSETELRDILSKFNDYFYDSLIEKYRKKLGFKSAQDSDYDLLLGLFEIMETEKLDYTNTFRKLSKIISSPGNFKFKGGK